MIKTLVEWTLVSLGIVAIWMAALTIGILTNKLFNYLNEKGWDL